MFLRTSKSRKDTLSVVCVGSISFEDATDDEEVVEEGARRLSLRLGTMSVGEKGRTGCATHVGLVSSVRGCNDGSSSSLLLPPDGNGGKCWGICWG